MSATTAKHVFLAMPGYGEVTAGAAKGWYCATSPDAPQPLNIHRQYFEGSLLAQNFNALWATALNMKKRGGKPVDYFAMQHSDVEPPIGWLDVLVAEMEEKNLDVLSVVIPIKSPAGLTSTALDRGDKDYWRILCRLTMREIYDLPETFTAEDVGHPLLLNTGLWVCRFDGDWIDKVHFTINDRIVFNTERGIYQAQVEPEDWFFSRLCHEIGLRIGATRKIPVEHTGRFAFNNQTPWGSRDFDEEYVAESQIKPSLDGWRFPYDVDGWLLPREGQALAELARGKHVLEIGSYCGKSTICMAQTAKHVTTIDTHDGRGTPKPKDTYRELLMNLDRYGVRDRVSVRTDRDVMANYDLAFIDGAHDIGSVKADIAFCLEHLRSDGILAFHDYRHTSGQHDGRWDPGVTEAVDELLRAGGELITTHATVAVIKPPAVIPMEV